MSHTTPIWVTLVVAIVGVLGTLAGPIFTQIWSARREDTRATEERRIREHEWRRQDRNRWFSERADLYVEFLAALSGHVDGLVGESLADLDFHRMVWSQKEKLRSSEFRSSQRWRRWEYRAWAERIRANRKKAVEMSTEARRLREMVALIAPDRVDDLVTTVLDGIDDLATYTDRHHHREHRVSRCSDEAFATDVEKLIAEIQLRLGTLRKAIRDDANPRSVDTESEPRSSATHLMTPIGS